MNGLLDHATYHIGPYWPLLAQYASHYGMGMISLLGNVPVSRCQQCHVRGIHLVRGVNYHIHENGIVLHMERARKSFTRT